MTKRAQLVKMNFKAAGNRAGRVIVGAKHLAKINPGPSAEAVKKIERFEASTLRAEQRLGNIRLV